VNLYLVDNSQKNNSIGKISDLSTARTRTGNHYRIQGRPGAILSIFKVSKRAFPGYYLVADSQHK